jgi:dihydroorotate dehydrogenase (NAD+) catalytic subunit
MKKDLFVRAVVNSCVSLRQSIYTLVIQHPEFVKAQPGQFIMLKPLNPTSENPRPFSVFYKVGQVIFLAIKRVGKNTELYTNLNKGDVIEASLPLGNPFIIVPAVKSYILAGGGTGSIGLGFIVRSLFEKKKKIKILLGAKDEEDLELESYFKECGKIETIKEKPRTRYAKKKGLVTDLLAKHLKKDKGKSIIVACGPKPMLKKVAEMCAESKNKCYVLLEEMMACGIGSCKSCAVFGIDGTVKHVCQDGPTFDAEWVDWEKIIVSKTPALSKSKETANPMRVVLKGKEGRKLILESPVMNASGCLDIEAIKKGYVDISKAGALVPKGFKLNPSLGNPTPRICETEAGMINSIGLENDGAEAFVKEKLSEWSKLDKPIIVNISGDTIEEYFQIAHILRGHPIKAVEINVSCPNIQSGGMLFGVSPKDTLRIVRGVRKILPKMFIIVKLTPNITDVIPIVEAAIQGGADAVSAINTVRGMAIDVKTRRPKIARVMGGLSGPAIKPIGVWIVRQIRQRFPCLPIIAMGGITSAEDAAEYIMSGADAVAVGTGLLKNPNAITEIYKGLLEIMHYHGAHSVSDLSGSIILPE